MAYTLSGGVYIPDADNTYKLTRLIDSGSATIGWRLIDNSNNTVETYDASGILQSIADHVGKKQSLTYDSSGRLRSITDEQGRTLTLGYDSSNRINMLTQPDGGIVLLTYDSQNNLASISYPGGTSKSYHYNEPAYTGGANLPHVLTGISDENGVRYVTYAYDSTGRAISSEHAGSVEKHQLNYGTANTVVTDPLGTQRTYNFTTILGVVKSTGQNQPGGSGCNAASSALSYDTNGNVASRTDFAGQKTCYQNDSSRNLETKRVEGVSTSAVCSTALATPPAPTTANPVRVINTVWHPDWRLEAKRAEPKKLTTWVYHGQPDPSAGNAIASCAPSTALLPDGKPIAVLCKKIEQATTDTTGASGFSATVTGSPRLWTWTYNGYGQMLTANGPRTDANDTTTYSYYPSTDFSNPAAGHTLGDLWKVTNPAGHVTEYLNYNKNGRLLAVKEPNGIITTMTYSPRGRLKTRQVGNELTAYNYDLVGQLKKVTLPDGSWIGHDYDAAHRLIATYDNRGNRIAYTLDAAGNRTKEDVTDPQGTLVRTQTRVYDALSRLQNVVQPQ